MGPTGTGKTHALTAMNIYRSIDNVKFIWNHKTYMLNYEIINTAELINKFYYNAFDGLEMYCNRYVLCLDDLGSLTEIPNVKHYGNDLDVVGFVITERYAKRLYTFATTNLTENKLVERYGDRVVSRMHAMFNFIEMIDIDHRKTV